MFHKEDYFSEDGHLNDFSISLIIDEIRKISDGKSTPEVDDHLDKCSYCKDKIMDILSATIVSTPYRKKVRNDKGGKTPIKIQTDNILKKRYIGQIAATFILILFLSVIYTTKISKKRTISKTDNRGSEITYTSDKDKRKKTDAIKSETITETRDPLKFKPNPNLEIMTNGIERSSFTPLNSFHSLVMGNDKVKFSWRRINSEKLTISILDNKNFTLFSFHVTDNKFDLNKKLLPGLYYWKLSDKNNLYHIGKFEIAPYVIPRRE